MKDRLLNKFIEFGIGSIITILLGFISTPIITRIISPEEFGKVSMFNTVSTVISLCIIVGLDQAFVRFFYEENEQDRPILFIKIIKIPIILSFIVSFIIIILKKNIAELIVGENSLILILLLIIQIFLGMFNRFGLLVVRMQQKGKLYSVLQVILKLVYIFVTILMYCVSGNSYITVVIAIVISNLIMMFACIYCEKEFWEYGINRKNKIKTNFNEIIKYGYPLIFTSIITWLFQSIDKITIKSFSGYEELGIYSAAFTIIALLNSIQGVFTTFWTPVAFENYKNNQDCKILFKRVNEVVSIVFLFLACNMVMLKDVIVLLLGEKYYDASFVIPFLVFIPIMYTVSETTVMGINFCKKPKLHIIVAIISCVTNLIGNIILVPKLGCVGAAISTGISYIVFFTIRTMLSIKLYRIEFNLKGFYASTTMLFILAAYMSFNTLNILGIVIGIITITTIFISYKNTIIYLMKNIKNKSYNIN